jgi:cytochrome b6-f complex iron-sulfur subunit/menaquinol-cytochrome c reductase iron-sulfur subunit
VTGNAKTDRRNALRTIVVGGAVGCGALAVPTVRLLIAPAQAGAGAGRWIKTVPVDSLGEGEPKRVALVSDRRDAWTLDKNVELGAAWLERRGSNVLAWSTVCPHLGCAVDRSASGPGFNCPCHDSSFDPDGRCLTGPSPRALDALATRVEDGFVLVEFRRYRQGIPDKEPIG